MPQTPPRKPEYLSALEVARRESMRANAKYPNRISSHTQKHRMNQKRKQEKKRLMEETPEQFDPEIQTHEFLYESEKTRKDNNVFEDTEDS